MVKARVVWIGAPAAPSSTSYWLSTRRNSFTADSTMRSGTQDTIIRISRPRLRAAASSGSMRLAWRRSNSLSTCGRCSHTGERRYPFVTQLVIDEGAVRAAAVDPGLRRDDGLNFGTKVELPRQSESMMAGLRTRSSLVGISFRFGHSPLRRSFQGLASDDGTPRPMPT